MNGDRFARLKEILLKGADLPAAERVRYLDEACKDDPDLRKEAESILAHDADPPGILKTGGGGQPADAEDSPTIAPTEPSPLPRQIAGYRIVRKLGEGGMGVVYEAEQRSPRRPVALKIVRGGAYVDEHRVRLFQREAQTLGRLKHPSIAAIYEAGRTEDGQHFFAMELVRGVPLDEYLESHPLRPESHKADICARLGLFQQICDAINYAHQRAIIHRDLKPSNILVLPGKPPSRSGLSGEQTQIKILDFGLARMTDADVTMTTVATEAGRIQGTLAYMSPEQARGNPDEIDLRSDVYSLGVILYELLTDQPPYDVRKTLIPEAVRVICEESPRRPSTVVKTLRGDLETIALKALEKEPARRFQSAAALAEDIERYLSDLPILARPPSAAYQFRKLVARHKAPFAFAGVVFVLLIAFSVTMTKLYQGQRRATERAEAVGTFLKETLQAAGRDERRGEDVTVGYVLGEAADRLETELADQPDLQADLWIVLGLSTPGIDSDTSESYFRKSLEIRRRLYGDEHPSVAASMDELGWTILHGSGDPEAERLIRGAFSMRLKLLGNDHEDVAQSLNSLADLLWHRADYDSAEALNREALAMFRKHLGNENRDVAKTLRFLARTLQSEKKYEDAEPYAREALAVFRKVLGNEDGETVQAMETLAQILRATGDYDGSKELFSEALTAKRKLYGEKTPAVAATLYSLGLTARARKDYAGSVALFREAADVYREAEGPRAPSVGTCLTSLGGSLADLDRLSEAEPVLREALGIREEESPPNNRALAMCRYTLGRCLTLMARYEEAERYLQQSYEYLRTTSKKGRLCMERLVELYDAWGKPDRAAEYREKLAALESDAGDDEP